MSEQTKLAYIIEEHSIKGSQTSKLTTTSLWLSCADFLIKMRSGKKQGMSCIVMPTTKTRDANSNIIFINGFLHKDGNILKEVSITTIPCKNTENRFDSSKTNDYYLSESYLQALKGLSHHLKEFKMESSKGLLTLLSFAIVDDNHILWEQYSPTSISDSLRLSDIRGSKACF